MKSHDSPCGGKFRKGHALALSALLASTLAAPAEVTLTFDTDTQGAIAGSNATSMLWNSYGGGSLALTSGTGWAPSGVVINLNNADHVNDGGPAPAALAALRSELQLALINGGTLSYKITVETDAFGTGPFPGWCQTIYQGRSWAGYDQSIGGQAGQGQLGVNFNGAPLPAAVEFVVNYNIEAAQTTIADSTVQIRGDSPFREFHLGLNTENIGGTMRFYIDDFTIDANEVVAPQIIPTVTITPAMPGLQLISSGSGQYDRQCVRTAADLDVSWVGGTFPKSYELTISDYPKVAGYETVIYFVPEGAGVSSSNSSPDYSEPLCAGLWIYPNGDGSGSMALRYKDHVANSNGPAGNEYWTGDPAPSDGLGGELAARYSAQFLGTWKITFTSDTDFTLTGPDGSTTSGAFNAATAAKFAGPMYVYFGVVPGQVANVGLSAVFSKIKITGTGYPMEEDLAATAFSSNLEVAASVPASVVQVTPDDPAKFWINWTLPATDFQLTQSSDLGVGDPWVVVPTPVTHKTKFGRAKLLMESEVSSTSTDFFRLVKPGTP